MEKITKELSQKYNKRYIKYCEEENNKKEERINNWLESNKIYLTLPEERKINYFISNKKKINGFFCKENFLTLRKAKLLQKRLILN